MADLQINSFMLGSIMTNGYYIYKEGGSECIFVDPGDSGDKVAQRLLSEGLSVKHILLTHGHYDHIMGVPALKEASGALVYACEDEREMLNDPRLNLSRFDGRPLSLEADRYLKDGEELELCGLKLRVITTPGHTKGGCCYHFYEDDVLISGDSLFEESIGRTDFEGGDMFALLRSIKSKLYTLPGDTAVYPGHGNPTSIKHEIKYNPYCK